MPDITLKGEDVQYLVDLCERLIEESRIPCWHQGDIKKVAAKNHEMAVIALGDVQETLQSAAINNAIDMPALSDLVADGIVVRGESDVATFAADCDRLATMAAAIELQNCAPNSAGAFESADDADAYRSAEMLLLELADRLNLQVWDTFSKRVPYRKEKNEREV